MELIHRIKKLRIFEGKSLRRIAKITGHDFKTVKKYVEKEDFNNEIKPKRTRKGRLTPYKDLIIGWLEDDEKSPRKQRHTAKRVYDRLKEIYGDSLNVSYRTVRKFVSVMKKEMKNRPDCSLPLKHPAGEGQADFGKARFIENGTTYDGHYLNVSYPHSNGGYTQLFKGENQECLLDGLKSIFKHAGGAPTVIRFDNMSTAVKKIKAHGERHLNEDFLRFMTHYGFESNFCNPNKGNEKGSVENKVGYHRRNLFVPIPEFKDLREYNKELLKRCDDDMKRQHYKGLGLIRELFEEDKKAFLELPEIPFEVCRYEFAKANNYGKIKFDSRTYSTSPRLKGEQVLIKAGAHFVEILDKDHNLIVTHKRLYGKEKESMIWLPYLDLISKRPKALKYTGIFEQLPLTLKQFLENCDYVCKKETLAILCKMAKKSGMDTALAVIEEGIKCGARDADGIWATYCRLTSANLPEIDIHLPDTVPELKGYKPDLSIYDKLINSGGII